MKTSRCKQSISNEEPLPQPFELPRNYPRIVQEGLKEGRLTGRARTKFITTVAAAVFRYKNYPTREEYEHVAQRIVTNYQFMHVGSGGGYVSY